MRVIDPIPYHVNHLFLGAALNTDYTIITMNARFGIILIISTLFASFAAGQAEESVESKGVILSLEQDTATVSLEVAGSVKEGDRVRIDRINDEDEVEVIAWYQDAARQGHSAS